LLRDYDDKAVMELGKEKEIENAQLLAVIYEVLYK